jgi:hypothetical protein
MVKRENLLIIAGLFWIFAGVNVDIVGIQSFLQTDSAVWVWELLFMVLVFCAFGMMFRKVSQKHLKRILAHPFRKASVLRTFDVKGYLIIAVMMGGGMGLRMSGLVPSTFIGSFYPGLGTALALTGIILLVARIRIPAETLAPATDVEN